MHFISANNKSCETSEPPPPPTRDERFVRTPMAAEGTKRSQSFKMRHFKTVQPVGFILLVIGAVMMHLSPRFRCVDAKSADGDKLSDWLMAERLSAATDSGPEKLDFRLKNPLSGAGSDLNIEDYRDSPCQLVPVMHVLHQVGCLPRAISSFACVGSCPSYVQVSSSKFWQRERSCSCCQQTGLKEATFTLDCPSLSPPYRKVKTYAPVECLCRSCTDLGRENLQPQELVEAMMSQQV